VPAHEVVFESDRLGSAEATVVVPLYNYARFITEALDSVRAQTLAELDLIVVDDASTDDSLAVARAWMERHAERFNRALLLRNTPNAGLGFTRNVGFTEADTPYVLPLDADNRLNPDLCREAVAAAERTGAAFVYSRIRQFGDQVELMGDWRYDPVRLVSGNYIDAMALVRRSAWADVGGYDHVRFGWEDYDLWCRFAERGYFGERLMDVLAEYRVHGQSMLHSETDVVRNKQTLMADMEGRHRWLRVDRPDGWDEMLRRLDRDSAAE
jgi:glycosyltransferase involved in cell wall biosynthesis